MPFFNRDNASIYYEDDGAGEPVVAVHGLIENTAYWRLSGITGRLTTAGYRVVAMDMRGHGRTKTEGEPAGYDAQTVAADVEALADHLGLGRFYLLTHSTGGFAASRWAMKNSARLAGLILTNTSSATSPFPGTKEQRDQFYEKFAASFEEHTWEETMDFIRKRPFPFFRGIAETADNAAMWDKSFVMIRMGDRNRIAAFVRSFYRDPDMMVEGLKKIACPVLVVVGEKDDLFIEPSRIMAQNIPDCRHVLFEGIGHMTAIEAPDRLADELLRFLAAHPVNRAGTT
jgi:pimeloyl-ACP methyl ester carboxylesterase